MNEEIAGGGQFLVCGLQSFGDQDLFQYCLHPAITIIKITFYDINLFIF